VFTFEVATVEAAANPVANAYAERVVAAWRRLGLRPRLVAYGAAELAERRLIPGRYDAAVIDVNLGLDPDLYPLLASSQAVTGGSNISGYQSAKLDALLEAARGQADPATRRARFTALQKALATELPMLPLVFADYRYLVRETLAGPAPREVSSGSDRFWDVLTWRLADGPVR
ncbi:MAG TPA: hypothetical protein VFK38_01930, partial [Candidatus Limnocylindrales bacterium]|nr:hypothetical protein [Candidatus Limnocylindrales bacterium]